MNTPMYFMKMFVLSYAKYWINKAVTFKPYMKINNTILGADMETYRKPQHKTTMHLK